MKQKDIRIGSGYSCYVSTMRTNVVVTGTRKNSKNRTEFIVKREDNGRELQSRSAAALKPALRKVDVDVEGIAKGTHSLEVKPLHHDGSRFDGYLVGA